MIWNQVHSLLEIAELEAIRENSEKTLEKKRAEESEIIVQVNEYKSCFDGIVNAKNILTKLSKKNGSPPLPKTKKDDVEVKPQPPTKRRPEAPEGRATSVRLRRGCRWRDAHSCGVWEKGPQTPQHHSAN